VHLKLLGMPEAQRLLQIPLHLVRCPLDVFCEKEIPNLFCIQFKTLCMPEAQWLFQIALCLVGRTLDATIVDVPKHTPHDLPVIVIQEQLNSSLTFSRGAINIKN
jgi:hypothetical protein